MAVDANCDKYVWIGATNFEVDNKKIKIKINGDQAVNAFLTVIFRLFLTSFRIQDLALT